nr:hypothetical protein Iba_chr11aCG11640 [Ipomoea batatas]
MFLATLRQGLQKLLKIRLNAVSTNLKNTICTATLFHSYDSLLLRKSESRQAKHYLEVLKEWVSLPCITPSNIEQCRTPSKIAYCHYHSKIFVGGRILYSAWFDMVISMHDS